MLDIRFRINNQGLQNLNIDHFKSLEWFMRFLVFLDVVQNLPRKTEVQRTLIFVDADQICSFRCSAPKQPILRYPNVTVRCTLQSINSQIPANIAVRCTGIAEFVPPMFFGPSHNAAIGLYSQTWIR